MQPGSSPRRLVTALLVTALQAAGCTRAHAQPRRPAQGTPPAPAATAPTVSVGRYPAFPDRPSVLASDAFHAAWDDGRAEMSGYHATVPRYGELRNGELVLVYVTEPMDRRTWIKDDDVPAPERVTVLKLNASLKFQTGIYPYSVLTSVFAPIDGYRPERFSPVKVTLTAQEWCGQVFQGVWPGDDRYVEQVFSYFASEGESRDEVPTAPGTLYEDALLIQLRELDGPFASGHDWSGSIVPGLWYTRRAHHPLRPVAASITRTRETLAGAGVHRFVLRYGTFTRTFDVEATGAHRVLAWRTSDGEDVRLLRTARLPYWQMNHGADVGHRADLGLPVPTEAPPVPLPGAGPIGF